MLDSMVEADKKEHNNTADLEDTVRNLREENAKLLQLLRSQGLLPDSSINQNAKSSDSTFSKSNSHPDSTSITFDHSDVTNLTNSVRTTNQTNHQHINNHGSINQQTYNGQTVNGNQSNIAPSFNTVIQTASQPFVQNSSNTLVQNHTNLIQPINLVNFNNVSLDSIQSFFASQNNMVYLAQSSSSSSTTTTTTTTTNSIISNSNVNEPSPSDTHSILLPSTSSLPDQPHPTSIRPKLSSMHQNKELVPVIPKIKPEHYEKIARQLLSSSLSSTTTTTDSRQIRPKPSTRTSSTKVYSSATINGKKSSSTTKSTATVPSSTFLNGRSPKISIFSSLSSLYPSTTTSAISQCSILNSQTDSTPKLLYSKSSDLSISSSNTASLTSLPATFSTKASKTRIRNRKKTSVSSAIVPSNSQKHVSIASNTVRPIASEIVNVQNVVTLNGTTTKSSATTKKQVKHNTKVLTQCNSENILQQNSSSPSHSFAESISGLLETFDQELLASNFLSQTATTTVMSNLLTPEDNTIISSNQTSHASSQHVNNTVQLQETYHSTTSMPTLDEFNNQLGQETTPINQPIHDVQITNDYNVEHEQITSFMSEEDMHFVEMNFDENLFLKQFDLEDPGIKLSVHSDHNLFSSILTNNNNGNSSQQQQQQNSVAHQNPSAPVYSSSSLINNSVFTTVVPLGSQQRTSRTNIFNISNNNKTSFLPEEGVQLTARHIEPSQVATYESVQYQDILDDLVMVTDQDALRHAQVTAANDESIVSTDFSLALLEAANDIIKNTNIQLVEENPSSFNELQLFYSVEQEQEHLQKQLENGHEKQQETVPDQQPIAILEKLQSQIIESTKDVANDSILNTLANDVSPVLQFEQINSPSDHDRSTTDLNTPVRLTKTLSHSVYISKSPMYVDQPIHIDSDVPLTNRNDNGSAVSYYPISDALPMSLTSVEQQFSLTQSTTKSCTNSESISSPPSPSSSMRPSHTDMIIDSGRVNELQEEKRDTFQNDTNIEELLSDKINNQLEIVENQGRVLIKNPAIIDNIDESVDQIETSSKRINSQSFEQVFLRYQQKYYLNIKQAEENSSKKSTEQLIMIPPIKVRHHSSHSESILKEEQQVLSLLPQQNDGDSIEHSSLEVRIRAKLSSTTSNEDENQIRISNNGKQKKTHHHHQQQQKKKKYLDEQSETEEVGLTRIEKPLVQVHHQPSPLTPDENVSKSEISSSSQSHSESQTIHSGFMINEETPPSSMASLEHKQSPPPLLRDQIKHEQLKTNYPHVFNYDNNQDHQNNNMFITPPPETDGHISQQHKLNGYENFCPFSNSPNKKKHNRRKSSVTSSTSSKSLTNADYAIDTQELEPVSPTPISTSKQKHSQNHSSSNSNDISPSYFEHQQPKSTRDYHSKKSSSNRSSRMATSQGHPQSRSSNHNYRTSQEPPLIPPVLPAPPPPPLHIDPYAPAYHPFVPRAVPPPPYFNFPFSNPYLNPNPHATTPSHFHPHPMKYRHPHYHPHLSHGYPTHPQQYSYHPHLQRQQQYNNSNYMSSRDHHSFDR